MKISKNWVSLTITCLLVLPASVSFSADYTAEVRGAIGTSDNISRTPQNEIDETLMSAGFRFGVSEQNSRIDFSLASRFDYVYYADDTFEEEFVGGINANLSAVLIEERLRWNFQDTFGQQLADSLGAATPSNREHVNFFSTGPTINFLTGGRNFITLSPTYSRYDYETRPADNDQFAGVLSVGRQIQRGRSLSLNLSAGRTIYDNGGLTPPSDRAAAYIRYTAESERNTLSIDLGYNEYEFQGIEGDGIILQLDWAKSVSANGTVVVSGGSRFADQGDFFRFGQSQRADLGDTTDSASSNAPFLNNFASIGYSVRRDRYTMTTSVSWNQEDYSDRFGLDRDSVRGYFRLSRDFSRQLFVNVSAAFNHRDFKYINRRDDDMELGIELGYRVAPTLNVSLEYQRRQRNSVVADADYLENRAFLRFAYTPNWGDFSSR